MTRFSPFLLSVLLIGACAVNKVDLVAENIVRVERTESENASIEKVAVHQHNGEMEIEVVVRPKQREMFFVSGDIAVEIIDPNGNSFSLIEKHSDRDHHDIYSKLQHAHFWVRFPYTPSPGTLVRIRHIDTSK